VEELARHPDRIEIVLEKMLKHFLEHPDPSGFKAQGVAVDRKACALYKTALDDKLRARAAAGMVGCYHLRGAEQ
jgi:type I restriction enzyme R subunit